MNHKNHFLESIEHMFGFSFCVQNSTRCATEFRLSLHVYCALGLHLK